MAQGATLLPWMREVLRSNLGRYKLSRLSFFVHFLSLARQSFELGHDSFLPHSSQFIIHYYRFIRRVYLELLAVKHKRNNE
jgi:hypothetical protein